MGYTHYWKLDTRPPHPSWVPMRPPNLASFDDECDGCHKRLCDGIVP